MCQFRLILRCIVDSSKNRLIDGKSPLVEESIVDSNLDNNVFRFNVLRPVAPGANGASSAAPALSAVQPAPVSSDAVRSSRRGSPSNARFPERGAVIAALREIVGLALNPSMLRLSPKGQPLLSRAAQQALSAETKAVLASYKLLADRMPVDELSRSLVELGDRFNWPNGGSGAGSQPAPSPAPQPARLQAVGISDLMVVKQQIKRYEAGEIAYIENVMAGESRSRLTRTLDRIEEVFSSTNETERETESEVQATDRYELNRETSRTQQTDQKFGFGLSISGSYGPSVEFSSKLDVSSSTSTQMTQTVGVRYAKELMERSKERVVEKVRTERRMTILRELEETIERSFENETVEHRSGIYQFVDKVYESQVFNYGLRQIFDLMIPEPASYLWYLQTLPNSEIEVPVPPHALETDLRSPADVNEVNAARLALLYEVQNVRPAPPMFLRRHVHLSQGGGGDSDGGKPRSWTSAELEVPDDYRLWLGLWSCVGTTDEDPSVTLTLGLANDHWKVAQGEITDLGGAKQFRTPVQREIVAPVSLPPYNSGQKLTCRAFAYETANYAIDVECWMVRTTEGYQRWQYTVFDQLAEGYANALLHYEQELVAYRQRLAEEAAKRLEIGDNPSSSQIMIRGELKKHCLAFIRNQHLGSLVVDHSAPAGSVPPQFDIPDALTDGEMIRFFEHAFEWDQIQFVFYPYFWARQEQWAARFSAHSPDPALAEFLKAGSARVVLPVRPGFEEAVAFFMENGTLPPSMDNITINSPTYLAIVDEIRQRTGAGQGEQPVGDPWDTRMPTSLLYVRHAETLPSWDRDPSGDWKWTPRPVPPS